jgi:hypothetical protein
MTRHTDGSEPGLDSALAALREDEPSGKAVETASVRVLQRLQSAGALIEVPASSEAIRGCDGVRALLPAHREGRLPRERVLLVEDHLSECAACRSAWRKPEGRNLAILPWRPSATTAGAPRRSMRSLAWAAVLIAGLGLSLVAVQQYFFGVPPGERASVQSVSGLLQRIEPARAGTLAPGTLIGEKEPVRTGRGSQARLRLRDGSLVELAERTELSVAARGRDLELRLARGSIIVEAAKRKSGRLRVASGDCTVEVKGTVFSVNHGLRGSRVSVLEGAVRVLQGGEVAMLDPGEQWTTGPAVERVALRDEIAWSGQLDKHLALLGELQALRAKWQAVPQPGLRYESRLLRLVPEDAVVYAAAPNYGEALSEAHRLFEERLQESAVLREWWQHATPEKNGGERLASVVEHVRNLADHLGDEVVVAIRSGRRPEPLLMAEVRRAGLRELLESELRRIEGGPTVLLADGSALHVGKGSEKLFVLLLDDLVAVSSDAVSLEAVRARHAGERDGIAGTPFGQRIAETYREGAGIVVAADLGAMTRLAVPEASAAKERAALHASGLDGARYLIAERKQIGGKSEAHVAVSFAGKRRGIASWLASPAPMGSLAFVTAEPGAVAAIVVKSPALLFDDVLALARLDGPGAQQELQKAESQLRVRLREDLAETLGGEVAVALDGPLLPTPSWKLIVEVYDPGRLQTTLQALVDRFNEEAARNGRPGVRLEAEQADAVTYYALRSSALPFEIHYAFASGYLVAAPSRALVMRALQARESGPSFATSDRLHALAPADAQPNASGLVYQNLGPLLGGLLGALPIQPSQQPSVDKLAQETKPSLLFVYGEEDRIRMAAVGDAFDLDPTKLALPLLLQQSFGTSMPGARNMKR